MTEDKKILRAFVAPNIRGVVNQSNELGLSKDDIVSIEKDGDMFILVYFK